MQPFRNRLIDAFPEAGENRTGKDNRRDSQNRTVQQGFAHIGVEDSGNRRWARVRRQETVSHGERSRHRHTDVQQRDAGRCGNGEHQRQHQHEAHFVEQREADGKTGQHDGPLDVLFTELSD